MSRPTLSVSREQIVGHRRRANELDARLPHGAESLRRAAWAGLPDSMPRAALLSIHARVEGTEASTWDDPSLVQLWGPRFSAYVVAAVDLPVFSLGRFPDDARAQGVAEEMASGLEVFLDGRRMRYDDAGMAMGVHPNRLRYGATTGRVVIRWEGARRPIVWTVPAPAVTAREARQELARRHVHVFGPTTAGAFAKWAGIGPREARATFVGLEPELLPVSTPIGDGWILAADEPSFRAGPGDTAPARLLPSGDTYSLLHGRDRELLVESSERRAELWTPRVWPGAVLVAGEVAGTWRRAGSDLSIRPWRELASSERAAVEAEAAALPLPTLTRPISVRWERPLT